MSTLSDKVGQGPINKRQPTCYLGNTNMKAWKWHQSRDMRLEEVPKPEPLPHEALIRIEAVGVCGSDIHYYRDGRIGENRLREPTILGHEYAGVVEAAGASADQALIGKRVAVEPGIPCLACEWCRKGRYNICANLFFPGGPGNDGALCEYMTVDSRFCFPVPETMSAGCAAMVEPAAVAVHSVELGGVKPGDTVAVFGLGVIGLLTARMAQLAGAKRVFGVDLIAARTETALRYGVDAVMQGRPGGIHGDGDASAAWVMEQTGGRGVDVSVDCTNSSDGLGLAVSVTRPAGVCVLTGISGAEIDPLPVSVARRRELTLRWCRRFVHNYPTTIALMVSGRLDVAPLITHVFPFERAPEAFALTTAYADGVIKASIEW